MKTGETPGRWGWLIVVAVLGWLLLLIGGYFWAHRPFSAELLFGVSHSLQQWATFDYHLPALLSGLGRTLSHIGGWLLISYTGLVTGRLLVSRFLTGETHALRLALTAGVGLGFLSLLLLFFGMAGFIPSWLGWIVLISLNGLAWQQHRPAWRDLFSLRLPRPENRQERWFLLFGLVMLGIVFLLALTPPNGWDSLVYHLTGPRVFLAEGAVGHPTDNHYLGFPLLGGMQFTLGMMLVGEGVAPLLHFGYGLLALVVTVALAQAISGRAAGWYAGVLLLSVPSFISLMTQAYVDATLLFYATAAFFAFYRWRAAFQAGQKERGWLLLLGLFCGFCGGVKYTAVMIPFALALSMAWVARPAGWRAIIKRLGLVAVVALAVVFPWLLENWLSTGNPVYPFFLDNALYWDAWRGWWFDRPGTGLLSTAPWRLLTAPVEASTLGTEGSNYYDFTLGPFLLLACGFLVLVWRDFRPEEKRIAGHLLLFVALNYLLWLVGLARTVLLFQTRLLMPVFGAIAVLGGMALAHLSVLRFPRLNLEWMVKVFFNLALGLLLANTLLATIRINPLPVIAGLETRPAYLERTLGPFAQMMAAVNQLPADAVVYFLWEPRSFYCQVDCQPDPLLDRWLHHTHYRGLEAAEIARQWQAEGATHLLLSQRGLDFLLEEGVDPITANDINTLHLLQTEHLHPLQQWGTPPAYILYEFHQ